MARRRSLPTPTNLAERALSAATRAALLTKSTPPTGAAEEPFPRRENMDSDGEVEREAVGVKAAAVEAPGGSSSEGELRRGEGRAEGTMLAPPEGTDSSTSRSMASLECGASAALTEVKLVDRTN